MLCQLDYGLILRYLVKLFDSVQDQRIYKTIRHIVPCFLNDRVFFPVV